MARSATAPRKQRAAPASPRRRARRRVPRGTPPRRTPAAPHVSVANDYARAVVAGELAAGKWTRSACARHLRDLEREGTAEFPYLFHHEAAERICRFAEKLKHVKGPKAGQHFHLEPWQCFFLCVLFGWLHVGSLLRRFKRFYLEIARGNGKSFLLAVIGLFMLAADGEAGAEIYSAAKTREQAQIVFKAAQEIARKSPEYREYYGVEVNAHAIVQPSTGSAFRALASDETSLDGLNVHFASEDELHAHPTRGVHDVLETALGKRDQPMLGDITTAGADRTGICFEVRSDLLNVLSGTATDESLFGIVYTIDDSDDWRDQSCWIKANPNLGVSVNLQTLSELAKKAERTPAAQNAFKTKHLDVWVSAYSAFYNLEDWSACADTTLDESQFEGEPCIVGLDLATKDDLAPRVDVFRREVEGRDHYYVFTHSYIPQGAVDDGRNASYSGWQIEGRFLVTDGDTTDLQRIEDDIVADSSRFQFEEVAYDPWQAAQLAQRLTAQGATMVEVRPSTGNFSEPMKEILALSKERRIHHDGDPVLAWAIGNIVARYDLKDNVFPVKERPENKIDPVVALLMAMSRWIRREATTSSDSPILVL